MIPNKQFLKKIYCQRRDNEYIFLLKEKCIDSSRERYLLIIKFFKNYGGTNAGNTLCSLSQ